MKLLYVSSGEREDYQCDALFHGLRELLGADAVDVNRIASLYEQPDDVKNMMYGRGYTLYGNLTDIEVDREKIETKIQAAYFDLVVFGSIWRCDSYLQMVLRHYPASRVVFIDGADKTLVRWSLLGKGIYFKRELEKPLAPFIHPIYFAVPAKKFLSEQTFEENLRRKVRLFAPCDPRDRSTYVFHTESAYYRQYQESYFGITMKKDGWDCMRHHEIVAQGTAPYFLGLENCPSGTLHLLPRPLLMQLRELVDEEREMTAQAARDRYTSLMSELFYFYRRNFTTVALAEHMLRVVSESAVLDKARIPRLLKPQQLLRNARRNGMVAVRKLRDGSFLQKTSKRS
jgi:hypothetical protein